MIEDGIYGVNLMENVFYMVESGAVKISVDGGEYVEPFFETTRKTLSEALIRGLCLK